MSNFCQAIGWPTSECRPLIGGVFHHSRFTTDSIPMTRAVGGLTERNTINYIFRRHYSKTNSCLNIVPLKLKHGFDIFLYFMSRK